MKKPPRFVALAVASSAEGEHDGLFALDEEGDVWELLGAITSGSGLQGDPVVNRPRGWRKVTMLRLPARLD